MFPMAVVDFDTRAYDSRASWYVETSTAVDANFSATFQVLINEKDKALIKAIEAPKPTREQTALIDEFSAGVMATVIEFAYALKASGDLDQAAGAEGSVGDVLGGLVQQTGDLDLGRLSDPSEVARRRSLFQGMARGLAVGRTF